MPELTVASRDWRGLHRSNPHPLFQSRLAFPYMLVSIPSTQHAPANPHRVPTQRSSEAHHASHFARLWSYPGKTTKKKNKIKRNHAEVLIQTGADNGDRLKPCILNLTSISLAFQTGCDFLSFSFPTGCYSLGCIPLFLGLSSVIRIYSCWSLALIIHKEQNSSGPLLFLDHLGEVERWKHASCQWNKSRALWDTMDTLTWKCSHLSSMLWAKTKAGQALWRNPGSSRLVTTNTTSP